MLYIADIPLANIFIEAWSIIKHMTHLNVAFDLTKPISKNKKGYLLRIYLTAGSGRIDSLEIISAKLELSFF